jgi:MFS family permease
MILAGINQGPKWGWASPSILALLAAGAVLLYSFVRIEKSTSDPLMPLHWVRTRNIAFPVASQALSNFAYMGGFLMAPRIMHDVLRWDTSQVSFVVITRPLTFALIAPLASLVTIRIGERATGVFGAICVSTSMLLFALVSPTSGLLIVMFALGLSGAGIGIANPALTSLVANAVDERDLGVAGAMQQLMNQIGAVLGSVILATVHESLADGNVTGSYRAAFLVAMGVALCSSFVASYVRSTPRDVVTS